MPQNKKVVYTCISGHYDNLITLSKRLEDWDYICFTDQDFKSDFWEIRPLPEETNGLSQVKKQRYVKIMAHKMLPEYDFSVWIDGNMDIIGDLNVFVSKHCVGDLSFYAGSHPDRDCVYDEAVVCMRYNIDKPDIIQPQMNRYISAGLQKHFGLIQSGIMLRHHNNDDCKRLMEFWWDELKDGSHRDQLSFPYAYWKNQDVKLKYLDCNIFRGECFTIKTTHCRK